MSNWLGLVIGNSRLHWAWFSDDSLMQAWDTPHLLEPVDSVVSLYQIISLHHDITNTDSIPVYLASVVPSQTALWRNYPQLRQITLSDLPLLNTYATLGIDRALAVYGAGETYNYPCLVIDGGTALTFTAVDRDCALVGGAILPGLRSQFQNLHSQTAALPDVSLPTSLPSRWASDTKSAIASGIIHTTIAGIQSYITSYLDQFRDSAIILTGGDSKRIFQYLQTLYPKISQSILIDLYLGFWGLKSFKKKQGN